MPQFGEMGNSLLISAQSGHANAQWYINVYGQQGDYIGTLGGTTTNGSISYAWDLLDPNNHPRTDAFFQFVVETVYNDPGTASAAAPLSFKITDAWAYPGDWVVAAMDSWANYTGADNLYGMVDAVAQGIQALQLNVRPAPWNGSDYQFYMLRSDPIYAGSDWNNLSAALLSTPRSRNFFFCGHGDGTALGAGGTAPGITAKSIGSALGTLPRTSTPHKFRFVCIDGCSTASGNLPEAFGIIPKPAASLLSYYEADVRPSAFVGFDYDVQVAFAHTINTSNPNYFCHLFQEWAWGYGISTAVQYAMQSDTGLLGSLPLVFGCRDLRINAFNP